MTSQYQFPAEDAAAARLVHHDVAWDEFEAWCEEIWDRYDS